MSNYIRKDRGSKIDNQRHVLKMGALCAVLIFFVVPDLGGKIESVWPRQPWLVGSTEITLDERGDTVVLYTTRVRKNVSAHFTVQLRDTSDRTFFTRRSVTSYAYTTPGVTEKPYDWSSFIESERGMPSIPFMLCLRYDGFGEYGTPFSTEYTCDGPHTKPDGE